MIEVNRYVFGFLCGWFVADIIKFIVNLYKALK